MAPGNFVKKHLTKQSLFMILITLTAVAFGLGIGKDSVGAEEAARESVNALNPIFQALPAVRFVEVQNWERIRTPELPLSRVKGVFQGESEQGQWLGTVIHLMTPGYDGPIDLMVALNPEGVILKVNVFRHTETPCHVTGMTKGNWLDQFQGITLVDKLRMLIGLKPSAQGDVQAMTSGTVTSRAVTEAVAEARQAFYKLYIEEQTNIKK
ncbi:MAG TPA: FMN-binding protein [Bacillota bacterium]|nr:FMN-binding protein [Bacillota bacterium]